MTALTLTSRSKDGFVLGSAGAAGGETTFELELNRSADFTSDDSLIRTGLAIGAINISGLPSATPWFCRHRSTNLANPGAWSNTLLVATLENDAAGGYDGFSMDRALLVVPEPLINVNSAQAVTGAPAARLTRDDPGSVFRSQSSNIAIEFDLAGRPWDTLALMGTLASDTATWRLRTATSRAGVTAAPGYDSGTVQFRASDDVGMRAQYHGLIRMPDVVTHPFARIDITHSAPTFIARNLIAGLGRQSVNYSRGASVAPLDYSTFNRNVLGTPQRLRGWRGRAVSFELSWLNEAEYQTKWADLDTLVGTSSPVFVVPNPKANSFLMDRMHFGVIKSASGENVRSSKHLKSLQIDSIY